MPSPRRASMRAAATVALAVLVLAAAPALGAVSDLGPRLTAKLLNASAAVAAKPKVNATVTALSDTAEAESALDQKLGLPAAKGVITPTATAAALPLSTLYGRCGAGVAKCLHGCCSSTGQCALTPDACGVLCQKEYSAIGAPCASNPVPSPPAPATLPTVGLGAPCGSYVGVCSQGCCNQLNYCVAEDSMACSVSSCDLVASPNSPSCIKVHKAAKPVTRRYKFVATWGTAAPDGFNTPTVLINKVFPAPTIYANAGDRIVVEYVNLLGAPSTIHWHGIKQINTNIMDGVDPVDQVGVPGLTVGRKLAQVAGAGANVTSPPPPTFLYDFIVDAPGLYWYHDHSTAWVYVNGLRGALVVADPQSSVDPVYANEPTIFVQDNYHDKASALAAQYINPLNSDGVEPVPKSFAINGLTGVPTPWCGGDGQPPCRTAVVNAGPLAGCDAPNTKLAFISGAAFAFVTIHVEADPSAGLRARIVTLDGLPVRATGKEGEATLEPARPLVLYPGQRSAVVLCADNPAAAAATPATIVMRAPLNQFGTVTSNSNGLGLNGPGSIVDVATAVLNMGWPYDQTRQDGATLPPPGSLALPFNGPPPVTLLESAVTQAVRGREAAILINNPPAPTRTVPITLSTGFLSSTSAQYFYFNNITFSVPPSPSMLQTLRSPGGLPPNAAPTTAGYNVLSFPLGEVVDFVIWNQDTGPHPLHLHGQSFWVMGSGAPNDGPYDPTTSGPLEPRFARDVAAVQAGSWLVIRFVSSHPALWFFHCHIEWHLADGLALVVQTGA